MKGIIVIHRSFKVI